MKAMCRKDWEKGVGCVATFNLRHNIFHIFGVFVICPTRIGFLSNCREELNFLVPNCLFIVKADASFHDNVFWSIQELIVNEKEVE